MIVVHKIFKNIETYVSLGHCILVQKKKFD